MLQMSQLRSSMALTSFLLLTNLLLCVGNETDQLALLDIKNRITQDPLRALSSWNDSLHFCEWRGVTCDNQHPRVRMLDLQSRGLVGTISPSIGNLSFLEQLNLQNNTFNGEIPQELGRLLRLQSIGLSNNSLGGEIPANLSQCSNLVNLCLASNNLIGKLPVELGSLSKLVLLNLWSNSLSGEIPSSFGNLSSLVHITMSFNNLEGSFPDELGQISSLKFLRIGVNKLSGMFPPSLLNLSSLIEIYIGQNEFYGSLPFDLGLKLPNLENFGIGDNKFSGPIPISITNVSRLDYFYIANNNFTGSVPTNLGSLQHLKWVEFSGNRLGSGGEDNDLSFINSLINCSNLKKLLLEDNHFGGVMPDSIANLSTTLNALALGRNQISGSIPAQIENLVNLAQLFMEQNFFSGTIPVSISRLQNLQRLRLHGNKLSGPIPFSIGNISQLYELYLEENNLIGGIPLSLKNYQRLRILDLSHNNLNGSIPEEVIGSFYFLTHLNISHNSLIGSLPLEVGNLKNLEVLDVSENKLSGDIPSTLGFCLKLERLYMAGNNFQGNLPSSLSMLRGIQYLDLSRNNISGEIPKDPQSFPLLQSLNLSFNNLQGELPTEGVFGNLSAISVVGNNELCGGIPELQLPACFTQGSKEHGKSLTIKLVIMIPIAIVCLTSITSFLVHRWRRKSRKDPSPTSSTGDWHLRVSYEELFKATSGFALVNLIGAGSFGFVYRGVLDQDKTPVAIKVLNLQQRGASKSFMAECEALGKIRHRNLLKIVTSCSSIDFKGNDFKAIVFKFMSNGNLENWLHPSVDGQRQLRNLSIGQRLNIAVDVASALDYLHHRCHTPIVHCDLKPSNVLLDDDLIAHVGDFGLAKFLSTASNNLGKDETCSGAIKGSIGYVAPEYGMGGEVSTNGDVYSYGILLLEMFTGRRPTDEMFKDGLSLYSFCKMALPERVMEIADSSLLLEEENNEAIRDVENQRDTRGRIKECLVSVVTIGVACSAESQFDRMDIKDVIMKLHSIRDVYEGVGIH